MKEQKNKKRKYFRKCGVCGKRQEQSDMVRTNKSDNGWMCEDCWDDWCNDIYYDELGQD